MKCHRIKRFISVYTVCRDKNNPQEQKYIIIKLEDLKVLRRSPDLFNNVKIGQGLTAYNKTYFVIPYMGVAAILLK